MKKIFCIALLSISAAFSAQKKQILAMLTQQEAEWNKGSIEGYMQSYWKHDSMVFIGKNGPTYGWQNTLNNYAKKYTPDKMGQLTCSKMDIQMLGDKYASVIGHWHLVRPNDELKGYFTLVLRKINNEWKIISDHTE
jgi:Domain of unknown function (DUF4440)